MTESLIVLFVFISLTITTVTYGLTHDVHRRVEQVKNRSIELYGEVTENDGHFRKGDKLYYPRGDKQKLALISKKWFNYYECLAILKDKLTSKKSLPSVILMVYAESVARLQCGLCIAPGEESDLIWTYAESIHNLSFTTLEVNDRTVREDDNLTIYHVMAEDAGVYRCQLGHSVGGLVVLTVVDDEENYTVVKPYTSQGPYPSPSVTLNNSLTVFSSWSSWTECSVCGKVGRRRRYGLCYIKLRTPVLTFITVGEQILDLSVELDFIGNDQKTFEIFLVNYDRWVRTFITQGEQLINTTHQIVENALQRHKRTLDEASLMLFEAFPLGIPCRWRQLPRAVRNIPAVMRRPSEIMIAMCKVKCNTTIFEVRSADGKVIESANNSAGVYSLDQRLPKQPPLPVRNTVFADYGQPLVIRCPGTTLRDVPVAWRVGTKLAVPKQLDKASRGRVHLNARDHLIFTEALYEDSNLYSCWQSGALAGTVKLTVWGGAHVHWSGHATLAMLVALAVVGLRVAERVLRLKKYE